MNRVVLLTLTMTVATLSTGCDTSCGEKKDPLLWADGVTRQVNGVRIYETTPIDGTWLHFPSYRKFELPHGFGTKDIAIDPYVALADPRPAADSDAGKFELSSSGDVLVTISDENKVIVENTTCENDYYLFVRITDKSSRPEE